jgi:exopolyphosphatase/guanosine-5'-triphosphate,3'-diphosphate pyrophosphatase
VHVRDPKTREPVLAGIDIGTLTCRLLIARVCDDRFTELCSDRRILRLGEGVHDGGVLREPAMSRVIETLKDWRGVIQRHAVDGESAVATSAVRDARNRDEFLHRAKRETGFEVEVLSGEEEARRTMLGIRAGLPGDISDVLGLDIGGGSTEFIKFSVDSDHPSSIVSVDLGVVRLTEAVLRHDPPTSEELRTATAQIEAHVRNIRGQLGDLSHTTLVGTAGTITTLAAMVQQLAHYEPVRIHNFRLGLSQVTELEQALISLSHAERKTLVGLEPGREDVILAGTLILRGVMQGLGFEHCLVSDLGLREGIILDLAKRLSSTSCS